MRFYLLRYLLLSACFYNIAFRLRPSASYRVGNFKQVKNRIFLKDFGSSGF